GLWGEAGARWRAGASKFGSGLPAAAVSPSAAPTWSAVSIVHGSSCAVAVAGAVDGAALAGTAGWVLGRPPAEACALEPQPATTNANSMTGPINSLDMTLHCGRCG